MFLSWPQIHNFLMSHPSMQQRRTRFQNGILLDGVVNPLVGGWGETEAVICAQRGVLRAWTDYGFHVRRKSVNFTGGIKASFHKFKVAVCLNWVEAILWVEAGACFYKVSVLSNVVFGGALCTILVFGWINALIDPFWICLKVVSHYSRLWL